MKNLKNILERFREELPRELSRESSLVSMFILLILWEILKGVLSRLGELITDNILPNLPSILFQFLKFIYSIFSYPIQTNLSQLLLLLLIFLPGYRIIDKYLLRKAKKQVVFEDDFDAGNRGWNLNYWGSNNPNKTNSITDSHMIFEASDDELIDSKKEYGAYFDLRSGIYEGLKYEVSCFVKSSVNATMGFQLWIHDTTGKNTVKFPRNFYTPGDGFEEVKVGFTATSSQAMRIHLHNKAGLGMIIVDKVRVVKVK